LKGPPMLVVFLAQGGVPGHRQFDGRRVSAVGQTALPHYHASMDAKAHDRNEAAIVQTPADTELPHRVSVAGHELTVFLETSPLADALLRDIESARNRVWVESYIFLNDSVGKRVAEALSERARAGVDVRLLYDAVGSQTTPPSFFHRLGRAGVQVHAFHSVGEAVSRLF